MDAKTVKSLVYKAASLLLLAIFLCTSVFIYLQKSFGWFSDNTEVSASGLSVQSSEGLNVEATFKDPTDAPNSAVKPNIDSTNNLVSFSDLHPGNKVYVYLELANKEAVPVNVTLSLKAPTADDEVAVVTTEDGVQKYTYFGAHIRINYMKLGSSTGEDQMLNLTGTEKYLLDYEAGDTNEFHDTLFSAPYEFSTATNKQLTDQIYLAASGTDGSVVRLLLEIEFVDNKTVQNPLIDFGKNDEVCTRMIICTTEEAPN